MTAPGPRRTREGGESSPTEEFGDDPVAIPVEDFLDLHPFRPDEVADVTDSYVEAAREAGFAEVRIIHGRGLGQARATVRARLARRDDVFGFADAPEESGGSGATIVRLRPLQGNSPQR